LQTIHEDTEQFFPRDHQGTRKAEYTHEAEVSLQLLLLAQIGHVPLISICVATIAALAAATRAGRSLVSFIIPPLIWFCHENTTIPATYNKGRRGAHRDKRRGKDVREEGGRNGRHTDPAEVAGMALDGDRNARTAME